MSAILCCPPRLSHVAPSAITLAVLGLVAISLPDAPETGRPARSAAPHYGASGKIVDRLANSAPAALPFDGRLAPRPAATHVSFGAMPEFAEAASQLMIAVATPDQALPTASIAIRPSPVRTRSAPVMRKPALVAVLPPPRPPMLAKPEPGPAIAAARKPSVTSRMLALVTAFGGSLSSLVRPL